MDGVKRSKFRLNFGRAQNKTHYKKEETQNERSIQGVM